MRRILYTLAIIVLVVPTLSAQLVPCVRGDDGNFYDPGTGGPCINSVLTAVPFLRITPDSRSGALGDAGLALSPDANAMHFNASRLAFAEQELSLSATYTPWLQALGLNDVYLAYLGGYKKLSDQEAIGVSLRYFSLGDIQYTNENGESAGIGKPNEFEFGLSYARKLSENFSASLTAKFINSNLAAGQQVNNEVLEAGRSFAADLGIYYRNEFRTRNGADNVFSMGMAITNIGNKITYTRDINRDFLPANFGLGAAYLIEMNDYNTITFTADINKLLVPTPCQGDCAEDTRQDQSPISAIFSSWSDAPEGFSEELKEFTYSAGVEYWYDQQFAIRVGYFSEHIQKGGRRYLTAGVGLKYNIFGINLSYLAPTSNQRNPLDNTLRFSLIFDFAAYEE